MARAKMSKDGAVVIPKSVRDAHGLRAGAEFEVIDGSKRIVLELVEPVDRVEQQKKLTVKEFLAKRIPYEGPDITEEMIHQAIEDEARRKWNEENSR